ncbi:hypothetical protein ALQ07_102699 [Pseudomonas syringae pv. actinidiae]|uniref:Uncharacterized protein n=1 Tax=Pseudomonas syringae pv. actinidiae TaxID=103796 RepID=A0A3M4KIQ5_PSESF|nr:hypothetical protein ALQ07_102699 [Pseudomonas syringae pv. actinidiae]
MGWGGEDLIILTFFSRLRWRSGGSALLTGQNYDLILSCQRRTKKRILKCL